MNASVETGPRSPAPQRGQRAGRTIAPRLLARLTRRDDRAGWFQLLSHLFALLVTGSLVLMAPAPGWRFLAMSLHGLVLVFLFAPLHECVHFTAFSSRALNRVVAGVTGLLLVLPPCYFRTFHLAHHRHTSHPSDDPERPYELPRGAAGYAWRISGMAYWVERATTLVRHALGVFRESFVPAARQHALRREARRYLAAYAVIAAASLATGSAHVVWLWLVPALLGQPALRLFLMAEHAGCDASPDMLRNSRTTRTNPLMAWLCWNMCYHAEHHAHAAIPFHRLPDAHALLRERIRHSERGYWRVYRSLLRDRLLGPGRRTRHGR